MRKVALDVGDVRIGIATSDIMGIIASGYETYVRKGGDADVNMDGTEGPRAELTRAFAEELKNHIGAIPVKFQDERLTTVQAERMLIQGGVRRDKRKMVIDKVAATLILQAYLDSRR